jgi:hypothetical protein
VISFLTDLRCVAFLGPLQGSLSQHGPLTFIIICFLKSGVLFGLRKIIYPLCKVATQVAGRLAQTIPKSTTVGLSGWTEMTRGNNSIIRDNYFKT